MKIGGTPITPPAKELLVLPRPDGDLVFWAQAVRNTDEFGEICPPPKPPRIQKPNGESEQDFEDEGYKSQLGNYNKQWFGFLVHKSLEPSNIEWDTLDPNKPSTWANWTEDFKNAGLTSIEVNKIFDLVLEANCLNNAKLEAAKRNFQRGRQQA